MCACLALLDCCFKVEICKFLSSNVQEGFLWSKLMDYGRKVAVAIKVTFLEAYGNKPTRKEALSTPN